MTHRIRAYGLSDVGRTRTSNEDSFAIDEELGLFIVADGMGGHGHGDVASSLAVETVREALRDESDGSGTGGLLNRWLAGPALDRGSLKRALVRANERLLRAVEERPQLAGMGTTAVALLTCGERATIAHVGDSRAYRLRGGSLEPLTHDHTWVAEQVTAGNLSEDEARVHPFKSVVTRALGGEQEVTVETLDLSLTPGDLYLLCSDGLTGMVDDLLIHRRLAEGRPLMTLCNDLVADALKGGGKDNVTAVALSVEERRE